MSTYTPMSWKLDNAVDEVLDRLGDLDNDIWSRDEIKLYVKDGYDEFCRRTKCLFEVHVIPNVPVAGNWTTDFERKYISEQPGMGATDEPMGATGEYLRDVGEGGAYSKSLPLNPTPTTSPANADDFIDLGKEKIVRGGTLPSSTVEVARVSYDNRDLIGMESMHLKGLDPYYEDRNGDPQWWTFGKDGLFFLRVVPAANGDASYDDTDGSWGIMRQTDDTSVSVSTAEVTGKETDGWGCLRDESGTFPAGSQWGLLRRRHPDTKNIKVDNFRLGLDLDHNEFEIPDAFLRYIYYWAMFKALERDGKGQSLEMSDHCRGRFEMGVQKMIHKDAQMDDEYDGKFGGGMTAGPDFGLGDPEAPYPYGRPEW